MLLAATMLLLHSGVDGIVVRTVNGEHGAGIAGGEFAENVGVGHVVAPGEGNVEGIAPVERHDEVAVLLRFLIQLFGEEAVEHHVRSARPGHDGFEDFRMARGAQQRVGAALAPAHHADMLGVDVFLRHHVVGGGHGVAHGAFEGIAHIIGGGVAVAHEVDADGGYAVFLGKHGSGHFIAVAGFVAVGGGAVQHHNGREFAFAGRHADRGGDFVIAVGDGDDGFGVTGLGGHCGGDHAETERQSAQESESLFHGRFSYLRLNLFVFSFEQIHHTADYGECQCKIELKYEQITNAAE